MWIGMGSPKGANPKAQFQKKREEVEPGWTEADIVKGLTHLYGVLKQVQEKAEKEENLPCKAGCSWCCENRTVLLSHSEWMVILKYLEAGEPKQVRKVLRRCLIAHKKYAPVVEQINQDQDNAQFHASQIKLPCPFLENKLCSIYEARPHDCRTYGNTFLGEDLYACHLVLDATKGREVTLPRYESSAQVLQLYPRSEIRQTFAYWAKHHLPEKLKALALGPEPA